MTFCSDGLAGNVKNWMQKLK